jgi:preprotein translocase subunit SecD
MKTAVVLLCLIALVGCSGEKKPAGVSLEFRLVDEAPGDGLTPMAMDTGGMEQTFYAHEDVVMSGDDVAAAKVITWQNQPAIEVMFTSSGKDKLSRITAENIGRRMGMIVDGKLMVAPVIRAKMDGGRVVINGDFTDAEAKRIADGLSG